MRPTHVVVSCDDISFYQHYWNAVKLCWKSLDIIPIRVMVRKNWKKQYIMQERDSIQVFLPVGKKYPPSTYAQFARLWYVASNFPNENDIIIISDIDMLPVSKAKLVDQFKNVPNDKYIYFENSTFYQPLRLSICYNICSAKKFRELFGNTIQEDFINSVDAIVDKELQFDRELWRADEHYLSRMILPNLSELVMIQREIHSGEYRPDRLEGRGIWQYDKRANYLARLKSGQITDIHCKRPYDDYVEEINFLVKNILELNKL